MSEDMRTYRIYKYTNQVNGKIYIGLTANSLEFRARRGYNYVGSRHFITRFKSTDFEYVE